MRRLRVLVVFVCVVGSATFAGAAVQLGVAHAATATTLTATSPVVWTVQQATTAMLHPTAIGPNASVIRGTRIVAVVTYGYAQSPDGKWDLNGNKTISGASGYWPITAATCRGLGTANAGHYGGFACDVQIDATEKLVAVDSHVDRLDASMERGDAERLDDLPQRSDSRRLPASASREAAAR